MNNNIHTSLFKETFAYHDIPEAIQDGLWNYMAHGLEPGSFLISVLKNNFCMAVMRADSSWNGRSLKDLARWVINNVPDDMRGSDESIFNWMSNKTELERAERMIELGLRPHEFDVLRGFA
jgi:hypothetical protein